MAADAEDRTLRIRLLGDVEVMFGKQRLPLPASKKTRALLAFLVAAARPHLRERLCELLWDGPDDPRAGLRWSLTKIRPVLGCDGVDRLVADRERVTFEPRAAEVDLHEVRVAVSAGVDGAATETLREAAARFRGAFLEGLDMSSAPAFQAWCAAEREQLRSLHVAILKQLVLRLRATPEQAVHHARALVALDPLAESSRILVIRLLAEQGQVRQALAECEDCRRTLERELGVMPSAELVVLRSSLRHGSSSGALPAATGAASEAIVEASIPEPSEEPRAASPAVRAAPVVAAPALSPFIGRGAIRQRITRIAGEAARGASRLLLVLGDPGVGKSRVLEELAAEVRAAGGRVLGGRAFEAELVRPYGAFVDALRGALVPSTDELRAAVAPLLTGEDLATQPLRGAADSDRARLYDGVARLLSEAAIKTPPLALVLDDLQWFDEGSAGLLHYLTRALRGSPVLLASAARAGELADNTAALRLVRAVEREKGVEALELAPLARSEVLELVRALDATVDADRVFAEAEGNPLFVLEVTRALGAGESIADSLGRVIADRLARIDGHARVLLSFAAALGRTFDVDVLGRVTGMSAPDLLFGLSELERHAVLRASGVSKYDFTHDLLRRAAYLQISEPRRRIVHARIAGALEEAPDPDAALAGDLAHHAALGGNAALAARACIKAAQRCRRLFAYGEAHEVVERGLRLLPGLTPRERLPIEIELIGLKIQDPRGRATPDMEVELIRIAAESRAAGLPAAQARAFYFRSVLQYHSGDAAGAVESSLRRIETRHPSPEQTAHEIAGTALCLALLQREMEKAETLVTDAESILGVDAENLELAWTRGLLHQFHGELDAAAFHLERALSLARQRDSHWEQCDCLRALVLVAIDRGRLDEALGYCTQLADVAANLGARDGHAAGGGADGAEKPSANALSVLVRIRLGRPEAPGELERALDALRLADSKAMSAVVLGLAAENEAAQGDRVAARAHAVEALQAAGAVERASEAAEARALLARLALEDGDRAGALAHLEDIATAMELPFALSARARAAVLRVRAALEQSATLPEPTPAA